jgi:uncharacterized damage-inducible protein DinB
MARIVPYTGGEKESLRAALDRHRDVVVWKTRGLTDEQLRRTMTPTGTNLIGLVKHLGSVEYGWFCDTFGRESDAVRFDDAEPDADMRAAPGESTAQILDYYARAREAADAVIAELDLEDTGTAWHGATVTLRWALIHVLEDTARHAGHMDIVRELLDGASGDHDRSGQR